METCTSSVSIFTDWLTQHLEELVDDLLSVIGRDSIAASPLYGDPALQAVLRSETTLLVARIFKELESGLPSTVTSPEARHIARLAALHGTPLDDVVNAHWEAYAVVQDAYFRAAKEAAIPPDSALQLLRSACRRLLEHTSGLIDTVTDEYMEALRNNETDENALRLHAVQAVLNESGAQVGQAPYDLDAEHVAVVASGAAARAVSAYARERGPYAVATFVDEDVVWAWFSSVGPRQVRDAVLARTRSGEMGIGAAAKGVDGFRQSHRQAQAAYRVCGQTDQTGTCFADVIPESIALADLDSTRGLVQRQLGRLALDGTREAVLRETMVVYLESGQNARAAAAKLGLTERTVANRLQAVRTLLPPSAEPSSLELALALRLMPLVRRNGGARTRRADPVPAG
ncbi:helix-turn-helix domain-containing protein [Streptomyces sp. NPDC047108]|uniref:helix-turn-helix domain-containing protein n=1 Tax=Streptomyces sp. NPDC047108 TaxID=3155025 RepID=UPI0033FF886C